MPRTQRVRRQALVQVLLARRVVPLTDAETLWGTIASKVPDEPAETLADALTALNSDLTQIGLEARTVRDQASGDALVVLANTRGDAIAEGATAYTGAELAYVRALVDALGAPDAFSISTTDALSLSTTPPLSKRAASDLLRNLVQRGWIAERQGKYVLAPRALCELDAYLRSDENALECGSCYELVTIGERCTGEGCRGALHTVCSRDTCAACGQAWHGTPVGPS
ncbi:hypothetical protein MCUN1_002244 [Malassezia cuniculi]|uniref:Non-structural maintenance of chromosomes element 1 homolog n=1 Tax=Malassezia cuniculi TaxID=948313 RepID=A0AAF0EUP9_9BASI|nr:hypothetical protein MCUN1_002244 [Malassezia cuniculi]